MLAQISRPACRDIDWSSRLLDVAVSGAGLIVLAPLFASIALAVKWSSPGPAFYRAERVGRNRRLFTLYKFRTMVSGADRQGPGITARDDPRTTRVGRLLRRSKLDELPQLINVFKGEMSLVGPRPEDPRYLKHYTPEQLKLLELKPGLTSPASLAFRHEERLLSGPDWESTYTREVLPKKLQIELDYLQGRSLSQDLGIILRTVAALFR